MFVYDTRNYSSFLFVIISLMANGPHRARLPILSAILPVVTKDIPISPRFSPWPFFMGDRSDSKKQKKMKFLWQKFCKHRAMGPKTQKFCSKEIANFCGRLFLKKNQNAPRPSEHPPVMGEKCQNV